MARDDEKTLLGIVIALLCVGAAVLLIQILTAERFDNEEAIKAFATAIAVAFVSLGMGSGIRLISSQPGLAIVGYATIAVGAAALVLTANLIWWGNFFDDLGTADRWVLYMLIGTLASGLASMLLAGHDDHDADSVKLVRGMTVFALFGLFVAVISEVSASGENVDLQVLGSFSVFYVLGSLTLPLLTRLTRESGS